jgi:type IV pilus assembly protein PilW
MSQRPIQCAGSRQRQRGIGLVEIMIAVTLGIIVTGAVVQIYLSTKRQNDMQGGFSGRQEVSRYATQLIQQDLQMAGFRGCLRDLGTVVNTLVAGLPPYAFLDDYGTHVQGYEDVVANAGLPGDITDDGNDVVDGTDVLVIRTVDDPDLQLTANMVTSSSDPVTVPDPDPPEPDAPTPGDIMLVTDCGGSAIFEVTGFDENTGTIAHGGKNLVRRFSAGAQLFRLRTTTYFIRTNAAGMPGLWRRIGDGDPQELAEGVENMQVLYGIDTDASNDGVPNDYVTAAEVQVNEDAAADGGWADVVSLQVALLVSSTRENVADADKRSFTLLTEAAVGPFEDGRLRQVVTFTVAVRNRLS